jgi:hypothetical protein
VAVDSGVAEQEFGGVGHVGHSDESLGRGASDRRWSGTSRQRGLSPTTPGCSALTRCGAISTASVFTNPEMPALRVVTIVEPG